MKFVGLIGVLAAIFAVVGCGGGEAGPTVDIDATVEAGVRGTRGVELAVAATVAAGVAATTAALPTATAVPTLTPTPAPTATRRPTATPVPTPSFTSGEIEAVAGVLYDCIQENPEFKQIVMETVAWGGTIDGVTQESAEYLAELMLSSREIFTLSFEYVALGDPLFITGMEVLIAWCQEGSSVSPRDDTPLGQYAAQFAGGPGAIYVGDLRQLAGPAVTRAAIDELGEDLAIDLGNDFGNVPLDAIRQHQWIYESEYYQSLLVKARLTDPTELVSRGESITIQHVCIDRDLLWCRLMEAYFIPNVEERTNGQVNIEIASFAKLRLDGPDAISLLADGAGHLYMIEIYGGYVVDDFPALAVQYLWGLWPDKETHYFAQTNLFDYIEDVIENEMGAQVLFRNWIGGDDQFFFSKHRLEDVEDFSGLKIPSHSSEFSEWIGYMGAESKAMAFEDTYTALERGILNVGVAGANLGLSQRWYEVVDYMNGPLYSFNSIANAVNKNVWDGIPRDLQQILLEEGAKQELEALRLAAIHNVTGVTRNIDAGLELVEFGPEVRLRGFEAARERVIPSWLRRLGYPGRNREVVGVFNDKIGPVVGLRIEADGAVVMVDITAGPYVGRSMEGVLSEE